MAEQLFDFIVITKDATTSLSSSLKLRNFLFHEDNATDEVSTLVDCISTSTPVGLGDGIYISHGRGLSIVAYLWNGQCEGLNDG